MAPELALCHRCRRPRTLPLPSMTAPRTSLAPSHRSASFTLLLAGAIACGSRPTPTQWPGSTSRLPSSEQDESPAATSATARGETVPSGPPRPPAASKERLIEPRELESLVATSDQPHESQGHEPPNYLVQVFVSPESRQAYRSWAPGSTMPKGTWLVARHSWSHVAIRSGFGAAEAPPAYTMYRGPDRWLFGAMNGKGLRIPVVEWVCHDCHTQARSDSVFGPVAIVAPSGQSETSTKTIGSP